MKPNTTGQAQPDLIKEAQDVPNIKTRTYKNADGTEMRDEKSTQPDDVEPDLGTQDKTNKVKRKAG
jgi:hypothetical protein